jgi:hypothetical protein
MIQRSFETKCFKEMTKYIRISVEALSIYRVSHGVLKIIETEHLTFTSQFFHPLLPKIMVIKRLV